MTTWSGFGPRSADGGLDELALPGGGSLWLCGKHVIGPDPEAALARAGGASAVFCLTERHEIVERYPGYVDWLVAASDDVPARAVWRSIPDLHAPTTEQADTVVAAIEQCLRPRTPAGELAPGTNSPAASVVVHCGAGHGRAAVIAVCVLLHRGLGLDESLAAVASVRPLAGPQTEAQRQFLESRALRGRTR